MTDARKVWLRRSGIGFLFLWLSLQFGAMFFHAGEGFSRNFSHFVLPPAWVGFSPVSYRQVVETAHAFAALQIAPSYQEAFPLALAFAVRDERLQRLLGDRALESEDVFTEDDRALLRDAGLSLHEQEKYLILPLLRFRQSSTLRNEILPSQEMRMQSVLEKIQLDMPFADIARYYSEDSSAMDGGDLGVFLLSELPDWAWQVGTLGIGEVRSDFVGADALWVLKVVDKGGIGDEAWVHIRGIAINKPTLGAILRAHAAEYPAWVFVW